MTAVLRNTVMVPLGVGFLALAWAKSRLYGYSTPNTVKESDLEGRIDYLYDTVASWLRYLPGDFSFSGKDVLEMSPGSSLGNGAILLALGAKSYHAVDLFRLAGSETASFFSRILDQFALLGRSAVDIRRARAITADPSPQTFSYTVGDDFDIERLSEGRTFDVILSCAAFEHYDDIEKTIAELSRVARPGCIAAHIIDFQTHSRWIRENDPNNIYRYSERLYRLFSFPGQPNRKRPSEYIRAFEANGWKNVRMINARAVEPSLLTASLKGLARPFRGEDMDMLSGVLIAEKA